jgi:hypothetical protein
VLDRASVSGVGFPIFKGCLRLVGLEQPH